MQQYKYIGVNEKVVQHLNNNQRVYFYKVSYYNLKTPFRYIISIRQF